jgi:type IV secretory pathway VirB10-like protein
MQTAEVPPVDPKPVFDEITVKTDSVIGVSLDTAVSSDVAKVEDRVTARVTRDVTVDGRVAIPSSSRLEGVVALVQRGGKFKNQARIGVRFTTLYLPDNTRVPIQTDTLFRDGDPPTNEAASKVGASAVIGAILGAVIGGKKGAAVGAATGAGGGAAAVAAGHSNAATIPSGVPMTVRLTAPVAVTVARDEIPRLRDQ